jgi:hypothetical protein
MRCNKAASLVITRLMCSATAELLFFCQRAERCPVEPRNSPCSRKDGLSVLLIPASPAVSRVFGLSERTLVNVANSVRELTRPNIVVGLEEMKRCIDQNRLCHRQATPLIVTNVRVGSVYTEYT